VNETWLMFLPVTPRGQAALDGPLRPGKTARDRMSGAWSRRLANRAKRAGKVDR